MTELDEKEQVLAEDAVTDDPVAEPADEGEPEGHADEVVEAEEAPVEDPLAELEAERAALADQLLRLQADFENFRKRTARERSEVSRRATEDLVDELLPVLDHFDLGLKNAREHDAKPSVLEGFELVHGQLAQTLGRIGLEVVDAVGDRFDPNLHEAISQMPSADVPADHVSEQLRCGYTLGGRLLRPAQVVVSSGTPEAGEGGDDA